MLAIAKAIGIRGGLLLAAVALALWFWIGWSNAANTRDDLATDLGQAKTTIEILQADAVLKEQAALDRAADNAELTGQERELEDARSTEGDSAAARRLRRLCVILRQQGWDAGADSACGRFADATGAASAS